MSFSEVFNEITGRVPEGGKVIVTHSAKDFNDLSKALFNDVEYTGKKVKTVAGEVVEEDFQPVKEFRNGMVKNILKKAGHDAAEAEKLANEIQIDNVGGLYEFVSEDIYQYMKAGKKFTFIPKDDFNGSIKLDEIPEHDEKYRNPQTGEEGLSHQMTYQKLKAESTCPKNKKK